MSLDMSDSDIEPFILGQDKNELDPQEGSSSTGTDLDKTSSPPSTSPAVVMSANRFFSKCPLEANGPGNYKSSTLYMCLGEISVVPIMLEVAQLLTARKPVALVHHIFRVQIMTAVLLHLRLWHLHVLQPMPLRYPWILILL